MDTKLLIVDDDPNICEMLRLYLENEGYKVKTASDGADGINYFKIYEPDLVLLDVMMPVMALDCTAEPMPNEASMANSANSTAITLPNCPAVICSSLVANSRLKVLRQTVEALFSAVPRNRNVKNQWR